MRGQNVLEVGPLGHLLQVLPGCIVLPSSPYFVEKRLWVAHANALLVCIQSLLGMASQSDRRFAHSILFNTNCDCTSMYIPLTIGAEKFNAIVVGAGFSGIEIGRKLNETGLKYVILEKSAGLGGTWYDNRYPGAACDITSHLYRYASIYCTYEIFNITG